jgi:hypothetical protein
MLCPTMVKWLSNFVECICDNCAECLFYKAEEREVSGEQETKD